MTDNGYVRAYRRAWSHAIFRDLLDAAIWNYLYQNAAWQDQRIFSNSTRIELKRGQIFVSLRELSLSFCCPETRVRRLINALSSDAMIHTLPTHRGTVITISNYDDYQPIETDSDAPKRKPAARKRRTDDAPINTEKETNEGNYIPPPPLPDWLDALLWGAFKEMRIGKKDPLTPKAEELMIRRLERLKQQGHDPTPVLEQSIRNGWKDVYPLKGDRHDDPRQPTIPKKSTIEILREGTERARAAREQGGSGQTG